MSSRLFLGLAAALCLLALAACQPGEQGGSLEGTHWQLIELEGRPIIPGTRATLKFETDGSAGGLAGCNSFGASETQIGRGTLRFSEVAMTAMACLDDSGQTDTALMDQESRYVDALTRVARFERVGNNLAMLDEEDAQLLLFEPVVAASNDPAGLQGVTWQLASWNGEPPNPGAPYRLVFVSESQFNGLAVGCRPFEGQYQADASTIRFGSLAMLAETCTGSEDLSNQADGFTTLMDQPWNYSLEENRLLVNVETGEQLIFVPVSAEFAGMPAFWALEGIVTAGELTPVVPGSEVNLEFEGQAALSEGRISGKAGCNTYFAHYTLTGSDLKIDPPGSTKMFCSEPAGVMEQETAFLAALAGATALQLDSDGHLHVVGQTGSELIFTPVTP